VVEVRDGDDEWAPGVVEVVEEDNGVLRPRVKKEGYETAFLWDEWRVPAGASNTAAEEDFCAGRSDRASPATADVSVLERQWRPPLEHQAPLDARRHLRASSASSSLSSSPRPSFAAQARTPRRDQAEQAIHDLAAAAFLTTNEQEVEALVTLKVRQAKVVGCPLGMCPPQRLGC
jgi:hypothetical protein